LYLAYLALLTAALLLAARMGSSITSHAQVCFFHALFILEIHDCHLRYVSYLALCNSSTVENSDYDTTPLTGTVGTAINVTCNSGFSGGGVATCEADLKFTSLSCIGNLPHTQVTVNPN